MKFFLVFFFFLFYVNQLWANEALLNAGYSWTRTNISGQNDLPFYKGNALTGELEYLIPFNNKYALSLFTTFLKVNEENPANGAVVEKLKMNYLGAGLKISIDSFFISSSIGKLSFEDNVTGGVTKKITANTIGYDLGIGLRFRITTLIGLTFGINGLHSSLNPSEGSGIYSNYGIWQLRGTIGLTFILPSIPFDTDI